MKKEFNFQSIDKLSNAKAALWAAPALLLTAHQYGLVGLATISTLVVLASGRIAMALHYARAQPPQPLLQQDEYAGLNGQPLFPQQTALDLTRSLDMPDIPVGILPNKTLFGGIGNEYAIYIGQHFIRLVNPEILRFIIAHELDHIRHGADNITEKAFKAALGITSAATIASMFNHMSGFQPISHYTSLPMMAASYAGTALSLLLARRSWGRTIEFRADSNALRMTGDYRGSVVALSAIDFVIKQLEAKQPYKSRMWNVLLWPFNFHPTTAERLENLKHTADAVREETRQTAASGITLSPT